MTSEERAKEWIANWTRPTGGVWVEWPAVAALIDQGRAEERGFAKRIVEEELADVGKSWIRAARLAILRRLEEPSQ